MGRDPSAVCMTSSWRERSALSRAEGKITKLFAGADGEFIEKSLGISMESLTGGDQ